MSVLTEDSIEVIEALLEYLDAIPKEIEPAIPGIDRGFVDGVLNDLKRHLKIENTQNSYKIEADHPTLKKVDQSRFTENDTLNLVKELLSLSYDNIKVNGDDKSVFISQITSRFKTEGNIVRTGGGNFICEASGKELATIIQKSLHKYYESQDEADKQNNHIHY